MSDETVRLTTAQASSCAIWPTSSSRSMAPEVRLCGGGFGIFGHGNVTCLGEALYDHVRGACRSIAARTSRAWASPPQPTPSTMAAPALHVLHRLAGPGTANLLTASALAHANRLPMLMLCGDTS
jgi:3D-(3,5/4)-trihydroxycyclohexane-1,2-dione acylhydrolase (decyclizing)